jgi:N6-adenosine-specific RNA methylase IME4
MNKLSTAVKPQLPTKIEDLSKFVLVGREKLVAVRAEIRAIEKIGFAKEVRDQKNEEAQLLAGALLEAEARIGKILKLLPTAQGIRTDIKNTSSHRCEEVKPKQQIIKEMGFKKDQVSRFETLAENSDIIEQVKAEAIENDVLPTRREVLRQVKEKEREQRNQDLKSKATELPKNKFQVIYCDPPWQYSNSGFAMSAENKYPTMPLEEIKKINVKEITAENAVIFMWATNPILKDALNLMEGWGFEYKTNMVWIKTRHTAGFYVFGQHELLLIGVKGSMLPTGDKPKSIITGNNDEHSKKPGSVYETIELMYPKMKYIELFARNIPVDGWVKWGNEVGKYE